MFRRKKTERPVVLIVDHSAPSRAAAERILKESGYDVLTAVNGLHAAHLFRERCRDIDVVVVDMVLPHMDGIDTFLAIREIRSDVKVILTGSYEDRESVDRVLSFGFAGFAPKPFDPSALVGEVEQVIAA